MGNGSKKAALLLAFGGIESVDDVPEFLQNIIKGRKVGTDLINRTKERYKLIGGRSPLLEITNAQAAAIEKRLAELGTPLKVYVGMRYWQPFIADTVAGMMSDGIDKITAVIMAPFTSPVATGAYERDVDGARFASERKVKVNYAANWHVHPVFKEIIIERVTEALAGFEKPEDALVIFSSHSLPKEALEGDAYELKITQTVSAVSQSLQADHKIAYQSQGSRGGAWLRPSVEDAIKDAKASGKKGVVVVPLGFVADHIETLYDIDINLKKVAESEGLVFKRTESLNTDPKFIDLLAGLVKEQSDLLN
jgi:ferrochelatase